jgi:hypothetical protein
VLFFVGSAVWFVVLLSRRENVLKAVAIMAVSILVVSLTAIPFRITVKEEVSSSTIEEPTSIPRPAKAP